MQLLPRASIDMLADAQAYQARRASWLVIRDRSNEPWRGGAIRAGSEYASADRDQALQDHAVPVFALLYARHHVVDCLEAHASEHHVLYARVVGVHGDSLSPSRPERGGYHGGTDIDARLPHPLDASVG